MAKCPVCAGEVKTPFLLNVDAWRWLKCAHCRARLERKNPRYTMALGALMLVGISMGRLLGPRHIFLADALIAAPVVAMLVVMLMPPQLQARKPLPEPEIKLKIDADAQSKR